MTANPAPKTNQIFDDLISALGKIRDGYLQDSTRLDNCAIPIS